MADELDFSVPQAKKRKGPGNSIIIILLLAVLAVGVAGLWQSKKSGNKSTAQVSLTAGQLKELASKLASRNFYAEAVEAWKQYLETARLSSEEEARTLFTMGDLLLKADKPEEALGYFYRSEMVKQVPELKGQINEKIKECFEKAGQFAALRYEIMERTSYKPTEEDSGSEVVAQVGAEKITAAQLGAMLEDQLDVQLRQYKELLPPEQFNAQKEAVRSQFDNPQVRLQFLGQMMAEEALQREALAEKLDEDTTIKQQLQRMRRQFLAEQYLNEQLAGKTHVDEVDVQTYYQAHKDNYKLPGQAQISHILLDTKEKADKALERLNKGEDFEKVAQEMSQDEVTKEAGGKIVGVVLNEKVIPGLGKVEGVAEKIFASKANTVLPEPVKSGRGWHVILVRSVTPAEEKKLEDVKDEIYQRLSSRKRQELQQELIKQLLDKYNIVIHQDVIMKTKPAPAEQKEKK